MQTRVIGWGSALLALQGAFVGVWALFAPRSFYHDFPGVGGRHWVHVDGPFNEHLIRDVGALYLALVAVAIVAAARPGTLTGGAAGLGWLVFSVPHVTYHAGNLGIYGPVDRVLNVATLGGVVVLALAVCAASARGPAPGAAGRPGGRRRGPGRAT